MRSELAHKVETFSQRCDPLTGRTFSQQRSIVEIKEVAGQISFRIKLPHYGHAEIESLAVHFFKDLGLPVVCDIHTQVVPYVLKPGVSYLQNVKNVIGISSSKGGVGKSTTAVNMALALTQLGAKVGLLDADIYGPSVPSMLGTAEGQRPVFLDDKRMYPLQQNGLSYMSLGVLIEKSDAVVWRGPMVAQMLLELLQKTQWGELDYLVVDMPPGTGDVQLTLAQKCPLTAVVVVTTPQEVACLDAARGAAMFKKVGIPILGVIENMAGYICPNCQYHVDIFGQGGAQALAQQYEMDLLSSIPLVPGLCAVLDQGQSLFASDKVPVELRQAYTDLAIQVSARLSQLTPASKVSMIPVAASAVSKESAGD